MSSVKRVYVVKREGCDIEAASLLKDIKENLYISSLTSLEIANRYDIEGMADDIFDKCKNTVFSEPPVDNVYENEFWHQDSFVFGVKYLPGQYDQRADSAMQCVQIISGKEMPLIECAKIYIFGGKLSDDEKKRIKNYCINPVDSMEAALELPKTLIVDMPYPDSVKNLEGFIDQTYENVIKLRNEMGLAMSDKDLWFCQEYFKNTEKRNPTITEIKMIDTYWSDHCRHTTFLTAIEDIEFKDGVYTSIFKEAYELYEAERKEVYANREKDVCLMDIAVMGMKALKKKGILKNLDESEEINACSIVVPVEVDGVMEQWLVMFKNETHNHPTEIEPFGGAATCLGGAIRDPLSGRSFVYQAMRVTGSGDPRTPVEDTMPGKLPQRKITTTAAAGYSSYGNQIGLATGLVHEIYDDGYAAKRMEIGAVIGAVKKENVVRESPSTGDVVILVGGRTGRDGCGGATGSSKEHTEDSILTCGAEVQKGNPITERKLQRLFRNPTAAKMIKRCNDFGAGGVSVAIGELADGLIINLDMVPKKYEGLDGTELAISESQERMAVVVAPKDAEAFIKLAMDENLEATHVAKVTDDRRLKMFWRSNCIVNVSRDFLDTNGARQTAKAVIISPDAKEKSAVKGDPKEEWLNNLKDLNVACQRGLGEHFSSTIGIGTVLMPFGGVNQLTPIQAMACKIPIENGKTDTSTIMSYGYDPKISKWSPFHGAITAVVDSVAKIAATGGDHSEIKLTFQEYFERLGSDPEKWGKPFSALLGAFYAQMKLGLAAIGGKDSMSGTFKDITVPPTLVSFALTPGDARHIISPEFKDAGNTLAVIDTAYDKWNLPDFEAFLKNCTALYELIKTKKVISSYALGHGGISAAVSKMALGNMIGAEIKTDDLFEASYGSFIVELAPGVDAENCLKGLSFQIIGKTTNTKSIIANGVSIGLDEIFDAWVRPLEKVFATGYFDKPKEGSISLKPYVAGTKTTPSVKLAKPRVFIPVFPGTNCEYDMKFAFEKAGAQVETFVIKNLNVNLLEDSIKTMVKLIDDSQMIALAGGFSAGDEPEGSGKFMAAVFRNPYVTEAVTKLLKQRDGLMLGICNGFQALIKLGLVPYGEIRDIDSSSPTLTFNEIGRHVSSLVKTKIVSNKSPWLWQVEPDDVHLVPITHCEGRFLASDDTIKALAHNGQIATQYVDFDGTPTYDIRHNPNGSLWAVEGISSPCGRVLGKMGHSERVLENLYKNVSGEKDQKIFQSGVKYFM